MSFISSFLFSRMCNNRTGGNREVVAGLRVLSFVDARGFILRGEAQTDGVFQG
jgi:hypothetical protein